MTIIVFDKSSLVVDRCAMVGSMRRETVKGAIHNTPRPCVSAGSGRTAYIHELREWYTGKSGRNPDKFPRYDDSELPSFVVWTPDAGILSYENTPFPVYYGLTKCAFGSGQEFAYGALAMGATALQAAWVASQYAVDCGITFDHYTYDPAKDKFTHKSFTEDDMRKGAKA